jgi:hypothetical protein
MHFKTGQFNESRYLSSLAAVTMQMQGGQILLVLIYVSYKRLREETDLHERLSLIQVIIQKTRGKTDSALHIYVHSMASTLQCSRKGSNRGR